MTDHSPVLHIRVLDNGAYQETSMFHSCAHQLDVSHAPHGPALSLN